jgi:hypothetical protein
VLPPGCKLHDTAIKTDDIVRQAAREAAEHTITDASKCMRTPAFRSTVEDYGASVKVSSRHRNGLGA